MGEDTADIIGKLLNYFDVKIPKDTVLPLPHPVTVGALQDYAWENVYNKRTEGCLSQSLFYHLRQISNKTLNIVPDRFVPSASMEMLIPKSNRRNIYYKQLEATSGYKLPRLLLDRSWTRINNIVCIGIFVAAVGYAFYRTQILHQSNLWWLLIIASFFVIGGIVRIFEPLRDSLGDMTVEEFIKETLTLNPQLAAKKGITRAETDWLVAYTISEHGGVDLKEVRPEKRLEEDLHIY